jgi:hypothetical protein
MENPFSMGEGVRVMKRLTLASAISLLVLVAALSPTMASADILGLDVTGGGLEGADPRGSTIGWGFTLSKTIEVTSLGYWDAFTPGLANAHVVDLWTSTGTLLATATASSASPIDVVSVSGLGRWAFQPLTTRIELGPGNYVIGGYYPASSLDAFEFNGASTTTAPGVTFTTTYDQAFGPSIALPKQLVGVTGAYFGPDFQITEAPEPGTLLLLGTGLLGTVGLFQFRRFWPFSFREF